MKKEIVSIEFDKELTGFINYRSGAVRWFTKSSIPGTAQKVINDAAKNPGRYGLKKVLRPFVTGPARTGYEYKETVFYRIECDGATL